MKPIPMLINCIIVIFTLVGCDDLYTGIQDEVDSNYFHGTKQFIASDVEAGDDFGYPVAISEDGTTLVVGASGDNSESGSVYVYRWNGTSWIEIKIMASDGAANDGFGSGVAVSGNGTTLVIGAWMDDTNGINTGSAYVFRWNGSSYVEVQEITAGTDGAEDDWFGYSVAISADGTIIVVGANFDDDNGNATGSAYVYRWNGSSYELAQKRTATDCAAGDRFGYSVAISADGTVLMVGTANSRSAYAYRWNGSLYEHEQIITASDGAAGFGDTVAVSGDGATLVVGASYDNSSAGSAFVYRWNGSSYEELPKLTASDGIAGDRFGYGVAISADSTTLMVGAVMGTGVVSGSGSAYVFRWNGSSYVESRKLAASDGAANDGFGYSVSVSGDGATQVVSAWPEGESGSVWLYAE